MQITRFSLPGRAIILMGAAVLLAACSKPAPAPEPIRAVRVLTVGMDAIAAGYEYSAEVRPRIESSLGFRVAGKITKRSVEVGQRVKAGQLLAQVDAQDYKLAADAARAQVAAAQTNRELAAAEGARCGQTRRSPPSREDEIK